MSRLRLSTAVVVLAVAALAGCRAAHEPPRLRVAVAVSLLPGLEEIARRFSEQHELEVETHAAASGVLVQQIRRGAPVDIFISASIAEHEFLGGQGLLEQESMRDIASNGLVLLFPARARAALDPSELADPRFALIALGNPETAPVGRYAAEALEHYGLSEKLRGRIVFAESARQVLDYVSRGEVDAAIAYRTDARLGGDGSLHSLELEAASHAPILYRAAITAGAANPAGARAFMEWLTAATSRDILLRHGFMPVS